MDVENGDGHWRGEVLVQHKQTQSRSYWRVGASSVSGSLDSLYYLEGMCVVRAWTIISGS